MSKKDDRIKELEERIAALEMRISMLEARPYQINIPMPTQPPPYNPFPNIWYGTYNETASRDLLAKTSHT